MSNLRKEEPHGVRGDAGEEREHVGQEEDEVEDGEDDRPPRGEEEESDGSISL